MKVPSGKTISTGIALAIVAYGVAEFRGSHGYSDLQQKQEQVRRLEQENRKLREEINKLDKRVDRLQHDPTLQELEVRKRLGLVKPGETVYVLQDRDATRGAKPPAK